MHAVRSHVLSLSSLPTDQNASLITIPFPTDILASHARDALSVDAELSSLVRRGFSVSANNLVVSYAATTHRMLRVAVNGFFESLHLVVAVMEECDVDVLFDMPCKEPVEGQGVQGLGDIKKLDRSLMSGS
jgi:EKC/KEOPS complex subunit PCC1/LAGE3